MLQRQNGAKQTAHTRVRSAGVKQRLGNLYYSHLPKQKTHRWIFLAVFFVLAVVIAAQLAYPHDRGLPFASANGVELGYASHSKMAKVITEQFAVSKIKLTVGADKAETHLLSATGAVPNTEDMIDRLRDYPLWLRFIPGSILWQPVQLTTADVYFDTIPFKSFAEAESKALTFPPQNARLAIQSGKLTATAELAGSSVSSDALQKLLSTAELQLGKTTTLTVPAKRTPPSRTLQDLAKVRAQARVVLARAVTIRAGAQQFSPSASEVASWILLKTSPTGDVTLSVDTGKVTKYLETINKKVGVPAGQTNIDLVNGHEASRTTGASGKAIDTTDLAKQIKTELLVGSGNIELTAQFVEVPPSVIYNHKYTATQAGLQAYVNDVAASRNMHIVVQQLGGSKWYAAAREHESIPSGSTYKLFVSLLLFDRINKGEIHWDDPMLDTNVAECFNRMTVASTNPCAEAWIAQFGRQYINDYIYARGFSTGTTFLAPDATHTTAADLNKFMIGLDNSKLVSGANRDRLLNNLSRHPYKYGIGTGSSVPANQIYDKVGFLWDYIHDTGIVPHPRGKYILTIMTKGQSYAAIANVTREIERIMYP